VGQPSQIAPKPARLESWCIAKPLIRKACRHCTDTNCTKTENTPDGAHLASLLREIQESRPILDFAYATGLRASELVGALLGMIEVDAEGEHWLHLVGKGSKTGKVALPPLARAALDRYMVQRRLPTTPTRWEPSTPLVGNLEQDSEAGITATRLWAIMKRFFTEVAEVVQDQSPTTAEKLRRASPHWMRHTHATHALARGAELTTVRDNLRHASLSTTSIYLHGEDVKRARQLGKAFAAR
jgi:site-specific recombinase XerD